MMIFQCVSSYVTEMRHSLTMGNFDIERKTLKPKSKRNQIYNIIAGKDKDNYFKDASRTFLYIKKKF